MIMGCPSSYILIDFLRERLAPRARNEVEKHLAGGCASCRDELRWLEKVVAATGTGRERRPSSELIDHVVGMFGSKVDQIRRSIARLILDSRRTPLFQETRTGGRKMAYLLYRADAVSLDLALRPGREEERSIIGQVVPDEGDILDVQSVEIKLLEKDRVVASTRTNFLGEFVFQGIYRGTYGMKADLGRLEVEIETLEVN